MQQALSLAGRGRGHVEPNPMVGCVIVADGQVIGRGYHRRYGGPHAEVNALYACGRSPRGATCYVTLEPCCHHGKTAPCTDALIAAGIGEVVCAMGDPFAAVAGGGIDALRQAGVRVRVGCMQQEAQELNAPYVTLLTRRRPYVIAKWAQTLDGKIAARTGQSKWISSAASRKLVHRWRGLVDCILTGVGTVLADDPQLTARDVRARRVARRIVVDSHLRTRRSCKLVASAGETPTTIAAVRRDDAALLTRAAELERAGVEVLWTSCDNERVHLGRLLESLGSQRMTNVLIEAGPTLMGSLIRGNLVDEYRVFVCPCLAGDDQAPSAVAGMPPKNPDHFARLARYHTRHIGDDLLLTGYPHTNI